MPNKLFILGAIVAAALLLIPVVIIARFVILFISDMFAHRAAEARKVTHAVPGLGQFDSYDNRIWSGDVEGVRVTLISPAQPPTQIQVDQLKAMLADLPRLVEIGRAYLSEHEDCSWLTGGPQLFEPFGLQIDDASTFFLELTHPADDDGLYTIQFRSGLPVNSGRED